MKNPKLVQVDFVAPPRQAPVAGALLLALGLGAAVAVGLYFDAAINERNHLDAQVNALSSQRGSRQPSSIRSAEDAAKIEAELSIPWSQLLAELEAAGADSAATVSLLQVEPDPGKKVVRITAEAKTLPDALAYLQRLQKSRVLRFPMLESHELKKDDPEHPVRVKLAAEWHT
jgi:hypothetical protein